MVSAPKPSLTTLSSFLSADPDGNVIFELNKAEIDDAHKDKQKMFSENFKVSAERDGEGRL